MNTRRNELGFERKIGYSFVGLLAGNGASLVELLLIAFAQMLPAFAGFKAIWDMPISRALGLGTIFAIFSMLAWAVIGVPAVLFLRVRHIARLPWFLAVVIGAVLGGISLLLIFLMLNQGKLKMADLKAAGVFWQSAAIISSTAFVVYSVLVKHALGKEQRKSGAPKGTPRFFSVFDL